MGDESVGFAESHGLHVLLRSMDKSGNAPIGLCPGAAWGRAHLPPHEPLSVRPIRGANLNCPKRPDLPRQFPDKEAEKNQGSIIKIIKSILP